ncbi:MAG: hypothetical protein ACJAV7_001852 [Flavobacteriales bacterium]|jgi:hypothetical protein
MIYTKSDINQINRIARLKIINSVAGIKLIGTVLFIGKMEILILPNNAFLAGDIDLEATNGVRISGSNSYFSLKKIASYSFLGRNEMPEF